MRMCVIPTPVAVPHPVSAAPVVLVAGQDYDDEIAEMYPWAFTTEEEPAKPAKRTKRVAPRVEQATAAPGEQRG